MTGQAHWIDLLVILLGALAVFGGIVFMTARWIIKRVRMRVLCPVHAREVDLVVLRDESTGAYIDVASCSAFDNPRDVRCKQTCRRDLNVARAESSKEGLTT